MIVETNARNMTTNIQDNEVVLSVKGVSKRFCRDLKKSLFYGFKDISTEIFGREKKDVQLRQKEFWALNDVSFELRKGEALGLVGKNGSGKSTLLRILSGLIKPDRGSVEVKGRLAPLIALGAGFNPILTGRENIYANMSILGLSKNEIDDRFDAVIDFAEIGDAIDSPVQTYSSGMKSRLGFSCAIHTEPDILLLDEVLAVGDLNFRTKCYRRLANLREKGTTFILVSHNPNSILSSCESAVYLQRGQLIASGDAESVMHRYEQDLFLNSKDRQDTSGYMQLPPKTEAQSSGLDILAIYFKNKEGEIIKSPWSGKPAYLCVKCKSYQEVDDAILEFVVRSQVGEGDAILNLNSEKDACPLKISPGIVEIQMQMPYCGLAIGSYISKVLIKKPPHYVFDMVASFKFDVKSDEIMTQCLFHQPRIWQTVEHQN